MTAFGLPRGGLPLLPTADLESVYWFEDGSGSTVADSSGNGVHASTGGSGGSWVSTGYAITSGNITHSTGYSDSEYTAILAFKLDSVTTSTDRWLWGWNDGVLMLLQPNSGAMRLQARSRTPSNENLTMTTRNITTGEWVVAAMTNDAGVEQTLHLWVDGTRHDADASIGSPISATGTTFRIKGSSSPSITFGFAAHYSRALGTAELELAVAAIKARVGARGVTWA